MAKRIKTTGKKLGKIRPASKRLPRVSSENLARALSAENIEVSVSGASPPTLFAIRQELARRLVSTGGRRALQGTTRRQKIPMRDDDWDRLEQLSELISDDDLKPTAGQVASIIIHQALKKYTPKQIRGVLKEPGE